MMKENGIFKNEKRTYTKCGQIRVPNQIKTLELTCQVTFNISICNNLFIKKNWSSI